MRNKKVLLTITLLLVLSLVCIFGAFAHSGRTDANGGHRDNNNVSGFGSYHYHCGGYPAHLHSNGVCPYKNGGYFTSSYSNVSNEYDEGYEDGYDVGFGDGRIDGYNEGHEVGYKEGYNEGYDNGYQDRTEEVAAETKKEIMFLMVLVLVIALGVMLVKFIKKRRKE